MAMSLNELYTRYQEAPQLRIYKEILASAYKLLGGRKDTGKDATDSIIWMIEAIRIVDNEIEKNKGINMTEEQTKESVASVINNVAKAADKYGYKHAGSRVSHEGKQFVTLQIQGKGMMYKGRVEIDIQDISSEHAIYGLQQPVYGIYIYVYQHIVRIAEMMYHMSRGFDYGGIEGVVFSLLPEILYIVR